MSINPSSSNSHDFARETHFKNKTLLAEQHIWHGLQNNGLILEYLRKDLRSNKEVVLTAVKNDGLALQFASDDLKNNEEVVLIALENNGSALPYASKRLQSKKACTLAAKKNPKHLVKIKV